jgi:protein subunit release factor B
VDYEIPASDDDLLAQCEVDTFRAGGPGGQHQNKTDSAVRLRHRPSGLAVACRAERSQLQNKQTCLRRLRQRLAALNEEAPERLPTRPSRAAQLRRLEEKAQLSQKKSERREPPDLDD